MVVEQHRLRERAHLPRPHLDRDRVVAQVGAAFGDECREQCAHATSGLAADDDRASVELHPAGSEHEIAVGGGDRRALHVRADEREHLGAVGDHAQRGVLPADVDPVDVRVGCGTSPGGGPHTASTAKASSTRATILASSHATANR